MLRNGKNAFHYAARSWMYLIIILFALFCLVPFLLVLSSSFSNESYIIANGYQLFPRAFDLAAYKDDSAGALLLLCRQ
ncbi:hypothetical protein ACX93W_08745 [Paenibacillus sp. CAU 1782]